MSQSERQHELESWIPLLQAMTAEERVAWAVERFGTKAVATSSFGADSSVLLHVISRAAPGLRVAFINTGFLFPDTLAYRARLEEKLGVNIVELQPEIPREEFLAKHGELYRTDPDACCWWNKVRVMQKALEGVDCWVNGLRRDQSQRRADTQVVEIRVNGVVKVHPLFDWSQQRVQEYMRAHKLPIHQLAALGYTSIGCEPCTKRPEPGTDPRGGRWAGTGKTECGLHTM
ncbi:MAG: phosphoadenylyl-sulfate reductase [Deltaproteobacteria bacterium]|nr:phosphoadenylyl-sulfate reductase [Deltaproteobacteria bacterium]